jgi:hypothetical protein
MKTHHFPVSALTRLLSGAALLATTALFAQAPAKIITLDHGGAPQSANYARAQGEVTFANGPANFYAFSPASTGEPAPLEAVTLRFSAATTITKIESTNASFQVESGGSCAAGNAYSKGDTCMVLMRFTPQGPGRRLGQLKVSHTASAEPAAFGLGGFGYAPAVQFTPALTNTMAVTYSAPNGILNSVGNITVDGGDLLYIADSGNTLIRRIDSSGGLADTTPVAVPASIAVDTFGVTYAVSPGASQYFSYYDPQGGYTWYFNTYKSGTCTPSAPCNLSTVGMGTPNSLSIDGNNNLFLEEQTEGAMEAPVGGVAGYEGDTGPTIDVWYLQDEFAPFGSAATAMAVNANDELFTGYSYGSNACDIVEEDAYAAEGTTTPSYTRVAGGDKCGYSGDGGLAANAEIETVGQIAFDTAGDLYFSDSANERVRMININSGIITTVVGSGTKGFTDAVGGRSTSVSLSNPTGVAVDSQGQIYVVTQAPSGSTTEVIQKVGTEGYLIFPSTTEGTASATQVVSVTNTGNSNMVLGSYTFNGADPGDFSIDPNTTNCVLTAGAALASGGNCKIGVIFKPAATGTRTAYLNLLDNTAAGINSVELSGTSTAPAPAFAPGSVAFPATTPTMSNALPVTVTNQGNVALEVSTITLSGANADAFSIAGNCTGGSIAPGASCNLTVTFKPSSTGNYSASLNFTDNAPDSPQSVFVTGSGVKPYTSATRLASAANPSAACTAVALNVTVTTSDGSVASGPVSIQMGALTLASGTLTNGMATLTVQGLAPGLNLLTASYGGDTEHNGSASATLSQMVDRGSCGSLRLPQPVHDAPLHDQPVADRP